MMSSSYFAPLRVLSRKILRTGPIFRRRYTSGTNKPPSPHAQWYSDIVPSMVPIALLGSFVYLTLNLAQSHLAQEKWLEEAQARVKELEAEIVELEKRRNSEAPMTRPP